MHGSLHGAMVRSFKGVCGHNPSYFEFVKEYVTLRVKPLYVHTYVCALFLMCVYVHMCMLIYIILHANV